MKITDYFKVGDKVKWIKPVVENDKMKIYDYEGVIIQIHGSKAVVENSQSTQEISLFELEVINVI